MRRVRTGAMSYLLNQQMNRCMYAYRPANSPETLAWVSYACVMTSWQLCVLGSVTGAQLRLVPGLVPQPLRSASGRDLKIDERKGRSELESSYGTVSKFAFVARDLVPASGCSVADFTDLASLRSPMSAKHLGTRRRPRGDGRWTAQHTQTPLSHLVRAASLSQSANLAMRKLRYYANKAIWETDAGHGKTGAG